ncbi:WD repeat-containing protein 26 [Dionaea muscipula]
MDGHPVVCCDMSNETMPLSEEIGTPYILSSITLGFRPSGLLSPVTEFSPATISSPDHFHRNQDTYLWDELWHFMGGIEEGEPPLKRVKESSEESNSFFTNSFSFESAASSLGDPMPLPLPFQGDGEMVGTKGVIRKQEFIKIITRALYSLGYDRSGALLEEESGIPLHSPVVRQFMKQVLDGKWDESVATLHEIGVSNDVMKSASFIILEQKFLELLQKDRTSDALNTLRNEITPLDINFKRVHELAACVVLLGTRPVSSRSEILVKLEKVLPAEVIIPERRLEHLVEQALDVQRDSCVFHNTLDSELSLYTDHQCGRNRIPSQTLQILQAHSDEVWYLQFSHNGRYLASTSKDQSAIIWEVIFCFNLFLL